MITQFITVILRRSRLPAKAFICLIAFPEAPALATAATHHRTCTKIESVLIIPTALSFRKAQNKCSFKHTSGLYSSSLRQISFWSHTNYSLAESRMFGPCRRLFVCLFVCFALHYKPTLFSEFHVVIGPTAKWRDSEAWFKTSTVYLLSVSQGKKLEHCSVQPSSFQCNFSLFKLVPLCPIPNKYCYVRKNPCHLQELNKPLLKDSTLRILRPLFWLFWLSLEAIGGWRSVRRHHNELNRQGHRASHRAWHMAAVQWLCAVQSRECRDMYNNVQNNSWNSSKKVQNKYRTLVFLHPVTTAGRHLGASFLGEDHLVHELATHDLAANHWRLLRREVVQLVIFGRPVRVRWRCPAWTSVKKKSCFQTGHFLEIVQCEVTLSNQLLLERFRFHQFSVSLLCPCRVIFITSTLGCRLGRRVGSKLWRNLPSGPWSKWTMEEPVSWTSHGVARHGKTCRASRLGWNSSGNWSDHRRSQSPWRMASAEFLKKHGKNSETQVLWSHKGNRQSLVRSMWSMWSMAVSFVTYQNGNLLVTFTLRQEPFRPARPVRPMRCV